MGYPGYYCNREEELATFLVAKFGRMKIELLTSPHTPLPTVFHRH
jgi:hypothetical protein